jgi:glycosyltransferase involved in cell wall biosynthesis
MNIIIVPCYNEEHRFDVDYFKKLIATRNSLWIFVNDGSSDNTLKLIKKLANSKNVKYLTKDKNEGKSNAIRDGMQFAFKTQPHIEWIGFLDADGAFSLKDIQSNLKLVSSIEMSSYDAVYSSRVKLAGRIVKRDSTRHIVSRFITTFFGLIWRNIPYDTQSGFKLYRHDANLELLFIDPFHTRWFVDIELALRYIKFTQCEIKVWEQPVANWFDVAGSKINKNQVPRLLLEVVYIQYQIYRLRKILKNHP